MARILAAYLTRQVPFADSTTGGRGRPGPLSSWASSKIVRKRPGIEHPLKARRRQSPLPLRPTGPTSRSAKGRQTVQGRHPPRLSSCRRQLTTGPDGPKQVARVSRPERQDLRSAAALIAPARSPARSVRPLPGKAARGRRPVLRPADRDSAVIRAGQGRWGHSQARLGAESRPGSTFGMFGSYGSRPTPTSTPVSRSRLRDAASSATSPPSRPPTPSSLAATAEWRDDFRTRLSCEAAAAAAARAMGRWTQGPASSCRSPRPSAARV